MEHRKIKERVFLISDKTIFKKDVNNSSIQSIERAFIILEALAIANGEAKGITELSKITGLSKLLFIE